MGITGRVCLEKGCSTSIDDRPMNANFCKPCATKRRKKSLQSLIDTETEKAEAKAGKASEKKEEASPATSPAPAVEEPQIDVEEPAEATGESTPGTVFETKKAQPKEPKKAVAKKKDVKQTSDERRTKEKPKKEEKKEAANGNNDRGRETEREGSKTGIGLF